MVTSLAVVKGGSRTSLKRKRGIERKGTLKDITEMIDVITLSESF